LYLLPSKSFNELVWHPTNPIKSKINGDILN
jgi:hypothetical protein